MVFARNRPYEAKQSSLLSSVATYAVTSSFNPSTLGIGIVAFEDLADRGAMPAPHLNSKDPAL
jgi:hypothetical protein